jgi:hypothetical protein
MFHTYRMESLPPEARYWLSGDHFKPQTCKQQHLTVIQTKENLQVAQYILKYIFRPSTMPSIFHVRFKILTVVKMLVLLFWVVTPCGDITHLQG